MAKVFQILVLFATLIGVSCQEAYNDDMMAPMFPNIVDAAQNTEVLATLVQAVVAAELGETLANPELEATVFAPSVSAFNETLEELEITLEELVSNISTLQEILTYHVVPTVVFSSELEDGMTLSTLNGKQLNVSISEEGVTIEGIGSEADVILADVTAGKAVVHVIDNVLLPF
eukprot:TRINITY_DN816_c0_g1_i10.p5 TRINITY_DN816_c0_g1~~TRINITY_DN816_c0_g1_i10.p5  ORF type:complete len:174 (-),score=36.02 TRINITY_DN816_c0_g1_i10:186-707(-)